MDFYPLLRAGHIRTMNAESALHLAYFNFFSRPSIIGRSGEPGPRFDLSSHIQFNPQQRAGEMKIGLEEGTQISEQRQA